VLAEAASHHLSQKVLIENRGGAGGTLAMPVLQQAAPDGYTIAQLPQTVFRAPYTQKVLWDPIRDVTPILQLTGTTFGMVVAADSPMRSVGDVLAAAAKQRGAPITIASNGVGTTPHVVVEELFSQRGLSYVHVPYKGVAEQMLGVATGQVQVGVGSTAFGPFVDSGKLRLLATFGERRSKRWPQVPTLKELGIPMVATSPYGLGGPRGMERGIVQTLHDGFRAAMLEPAYIGELAKSDQELAYLGPTDYALACREAYATEKRVVERLGLAKQGG
jgi:tripartite-type tricarboxylate transporter receptor subunit TctC